MSYNPDLDRPLTARDWVLGLLSVCVMPALFMVPALWLAQGSEAAKLKRQGDYQACVEQGHHPADCIKRYPL